jgi:acyl carrier protein
MDFVVCALLVETPKTKETLVALSFEDFSQFLTEELGVEGDNLQVSTPLFSSGLIDSFSLVTLMSFIENAGEVSIDPADVTLENFDSVERMLQFIGRKKAES